MVLSLFSLHPNSISLLYLSMLPTLDYVVYKENIKTWWVERILHNQRTWLWDASAVVHRYRTPSKSSHTSLSLHFLISRRFETTIKVWASSWIIRLNVVKVSIIYILFNAIFIKILAFFIAKISKLILKFIWINKEPRIANTILKNNKKVREDSYFLISKCTIKLH